MLLDDDDDNDDDKDNDNDEDDISLQSNPTFLLLNDDGNILDDNGDSL